MRLFFYWMTAWWLAGAFVNGCTGMSDRYFSLRPLPRCVKPAA